MKTAFKILIFLSISTAFFINYVYSKDIPHKQLKLECNSCHLTENWNTITFDHKSTQFPLDGRHHNLECVDCHNLEDFSQIRMECKQCHLDIHQGKLTYPCDQCHTTSGWQVKDIFKVHANTTFPVLGAHSRLDCDACHISEIVGEFARIQSDCYTCHEQDYKNTTDPSHQDFGFNHRCEDCHSMLAWFPAMFAEHESRFPISSGAHAGEWENCNICHTNPGNFQIFSCLNCHEHNQSSMVGEHDEISGFSYNSDACYRCHHDGKAED